MSLTLYTVKNACSRNLQKTGNLRKWLQIRKDTITFKVNLYKLLKKFPILTKSIISLNFCKNYFQQIK